LKSAAAAYPDVLQTQHEYDEMSEQFEHIEKQMFGHDGFEDAAHQMAAIESELGLSDIAQFTIPPPPVVK
jgi:hypothetical protein